MQVDSTLVLQFCSEALKLEQSRACGHGNPTRLGSRFFWRSNKERPVNEKSIAKLGSVSVVSEPALLVSTGGNDAPRVPPGQTIPSQETVSLDEIAGKLATVTDNANGLIIQVKDELGNISGDARKLLLTLNSVATDERPKIDHIADQLVALTQHADGLMAKIGPVVGHADETIQT